MVKVHVEARNDETSPGYVKLQGETWELNVWATTDDLWKLADIEATDWSQRRLLAVGRCARAPVWWHEEDGTVYIIVSEDYEAWDLCVAVPLATVRSLLDELGEPPEKPQQPWGPTLFLASRHPADAREEAREAGKPGKNPCNPPPDAPAGPVHRTNAVVAARHDPRMAPYLPTQAE